MRATVSKDGSGEFTTVAEAAKAAHGDKMEIYIKNGWYREKLTLFANEIQLVGEDPDRTVISFGDGANFSGANGEMLGTFRSYTLYMNARRALLENLSVKNTAGNGDIAGQAVAVYADSSLARFEHVNITSRQDTLFLAPLPDQPRIPDSFKGPGEQMPRRPCMDYFRDCRVEGDVDFIFGGAEAAFENCEIVSANRGKSINGYVTAACTPLDQTYGFLFYRCRLDSDCAPGTVYLGRPWREHAAAAFLNCKIGSHITERGWADWEGRPQDRTAVRFEEFGNRGSGSAVSARAPWVHLLTRKEAARRINRIHEIDRLTLQSQRNRPENF
ncbi:pectinesterase family protein [Caproicibacter fermentans]|uniref:Pectinesterase n=1 Tax=Caproicibacter fermentans TaxID=2576756 RepID=A0A7G8T936_9FIRM|nr:pectinesterase family protein [Caproicibacter fermentans]QNK40127.1 pectin methylesterase [Caproicibacter fermentans]